MAGNMTRRECISALAAVCAATTSASAGSPSRRMKFGVQLHGIRGVCARDVRGALAAIKAMGYEGIEAGNFFGLSPREFGEAVRNAGLELVALQYYPYLLVGRELDETVRICYECGARRVNAAWFKGSAENKADWQLAVNVLNHAAGVFEKEGLSIGYHNHDHEFMIWMEGTTAMEWMAKRFAPNVAIEFDPGLATLAGVDPLAWIAAHPHAGPDAHLTPAIAVRATSGAANAESGGCGLGSASDRADWRRIIPALAASGVEWGFAKPLTHPDSLGDLEASAKWLESSKAFS